MPSTADSKGSRWVAHAAIAWWFAFAMLSFYWVAGGTLGLDTLGDEIESLAATREVWFLSLVAVTGLLKLVPCVLVLSLIRPWGTRFSLTIRLLTVAGIGVLSFLYGGVQLGVKVLVLAGVFTPTEIDTAGFWGHLLIWDPVWIVGGVLLCAVAWSQYSARQERQLGPS